MKNIACHISKQRVLQQSSHHVRAALMVSPDSCSFPYIDVPSKRLPDWASLELSPSVESSACGLGPSPVRLG